MASDERRRRYLSLGLGELSAAAVFGFLGVMVLTPRLGEEARLALWSALVPLLLILLQASAYWLLARSWVGRTSMPPKQAAVFRVLRVLDPLLLIAGLLGIVLGWPGWGIALLVLGVWLFGVVEYLNYFVVRLAYPASRWLSEVGSWRAPRLLRDLRDQERTRLS